MSFGSYAAQFKKFHELVEKAKYTLDALAATNDGESDWDSVEEVPVKASFQRRGNARHFITAIENLSNSVEVFHRDIFPADYPDYIENIPPVWIGDPRAINGHVDAADKNLRNKSAIYQANKTPENEAEWRKAIEIEKQWRQLKWNAFYGSGDEPDDETQEL